MIVDASAIIAIALEEPEAERFMAALAATPVCWIAAINRLEIRIVLESRLGSRGATVAEALLSKFGIRQLDFDTGQFEVAIRAWQQFGKGRHPAKLNLCDCCAYAAAVTTGEPLLFKGNDFGQTDVEAAAW